MIVYASPLFDPTSAPSASPHFPSSPAALPVEKASASIDTCIRHLVLHFDFGFLDIHH